MTAQIIAEGNVDFFGRECRISIDENGDVTGRYADNDEPITSSGTLYFLGAEIIMDGFTRGHLQAWLDEHVYEDDRTEAEARIREGVCLNPDWLLTRSWREILDAMESD